jgi:hypothetical protein
VDFERWSNPLDVGFLHIDFKERREEAQMDLICLRFCFLFDRSDSQCAKQVNLQPAHGPEHADSAPRLAEF